MSNTLNFVLASPNDAADKIDEMEKRVEALEAALREIMTNKDEDHWEVNRIARAVLASPAQPLTTFTQPAAWRVDGIREGVEHVWFYWQPEWPDMHMKEGDKVTPLYAAPPTRPEQDK